MLAARLAYLENFTEIGLRKKGKNATCVQIERSGDNVCGFLKDELHMYVMPTKPKASAFAEYIGRKVIATVGDQC